MALALSWPVYVMQPSLLLLQCPLPRREEGFRLEMAGGGCRAGTPMRRAMTCLKDLLSLQVELETSSAYVLKSNGVEEGPSVERGLWYVYAYAMRGVRVEWLRQVP